MLFDDGEYVLLVRAVGWRSLRMTLGSGHYLLMSRTLTLDKWQKLFSLSVPQLIGSWVHGNTNKYYGHIS